MQFAKCTFQSQLHEFLIAIFSFGFSHKTEKKYWEIFTQFYVIGGYRTYLLKISLILVFEA